MKRAVRREDVRMVATEPDIVVAPRRNGVWKPHHNAAPRARDEQLRVLGQAQAALAHQIRNPLTVAGLSIEHLLMTETGVDVRERLERVRGSLQAIEQQIRNALVFVSGELTQRQTFAVADLVAALHDAWVSLLDGHRVEWLQKFSDRDCITGDLATLVGALTNIVDNAVAVGGAQVMLTISIEAIAGTLAVTIADNGPGMSSDVLARVRQPFVSERPGGTGLGLPIVDAVVCAHDGRFMLESELGKGTRARIELPLVTQANR